jgi:hypothetical protein
MERVVVLLVIIVVLDLLTAVLLEQVIVVVSGQVGMIVEVGRTVIVVMVGAVPRL